MHLQAEGLVDGGALVHELDGAAGIRGYVADGDEPAGQVGRAGRGGDPRRFRGQNQRLGVRDGDKARRLRRPVDAVDDNTGVGRVLVRKGGDVALGVLLKFHGVVAATDLTFELVGPKMILK